MDTVKISASKRVVRGKGGARSSRREGRVPGILYGPNENVPFAVDQREFDRILRTVSSGNAIFDVQLEGRETEDIWAILKEVQRHPVDSRVLHVDLEHIRMDQEVRVQVPVHLHGTSIGVKDEGGILEHVTRELELDVLATKIPAAIDIDVSKLKIHDSIHVRDLVVGEEIHIVNPPDQVVVMVVAPATEVEATPAEDAAGEAVPGAAAEEPKPGA